MQQGCESRIIHRCNKHIYQILCALTQTSNWIRFNELKNLLMYYIYFMALTTRYKNEGIL